MNTGARQECVFSPFLFTLYTNDCVPSLPNNILIKFSDDSALVNRLTKTCDVNLYFNEIANIIKWCNENSVLHAKKKKKEKKKGNGRSSTRSMSALTSIHKR